MLVIATFSVASMVSAYASASSSATPRAFSLVLADDVSQNALSTFIGAFIFSIVSLIALENGFYGVAGRFALFFLTIVVFAVVIATFVKWVDQIARLGRLGTTIDKVEAATMKAVERRTESPTLGGKAVSGHPSSAVSITAPTIGYIQRIDLPVLQELAENNDLLIEVASLPGAFVFPGRILAYAWNGNGQPPADHDLETLVDGFLIGAARTFDEDPRFGLVVLAEIAGRALSPGINDPGTAIGVLDRTVRIFARVGAGSKTEARPGVQYDRVAVPEIEINDLFDDAYNSIGRDGAGSIEVVVRLQKALASLATMPRYGMREAALEQARRAYMRAQKTLSHPDDQAMAEKAASFALDAGAN